MIKIAQHASARIGAVAGAAVLTAALACSVALPVQPALAVTAAEKEAEAQSALVQLNAMQETLNQASANYYQCLFDYQSAVTARDAAEKRVNELTAEISEIQGRLGNRARDMYREGSASVVDVLLGSASFKEFTNNWDLLNRMNQDDAEMSRQVKELRAEAEDQKAEYTEQAQIAEQKSEEAGAAYQEAESLVYQMQATYQSLSEEARALYAQEQAAAQAAAAAAAQAQMQGGGGAAYSSDGESGEIQYEYDYVPADENVVVNDDGSVTDTSTGTTYSDAVAYNAQTGAAIVERARAMIGSEYVVGGVGGADGGFDCSGLVSYAITGENERIGWTGTMINWNQVSDPQPGDIVVIHEEDGLQHTGVYAGDGMMIHAVVPGVGVVEEPVYDGMIYVRQY